MTLDSQIIALRKQGLLASEIAERLEITIWRVHCALESCPRHLRHVGQNLGTGEAIFGLQTSARKRGLE